MGVFDDLIPAQPQGSPPQAAQSTPAASPPTSGGTMAFSQATPSQQAYAVAQGQGLDYGSAGQSPSNPTYDTGAARGDPSTYHVSGAGQLNVPVGQPGSAINLHPGGNAFDDLIPKVNMGMDALQTLPGALERGVSGLVGLPGTLANLEGNAVDWLGDRLNGNRGPQPVENYAHDAGLVSGADLDRAAVSAVPGLGYAPQTAAGRLVNTAGEMAPGLVAGPEELVARGLAYAAPVVASDAAGEVARSVAPQYEGAARFAGGVVGGLGVSRLPGIAASGAQKVIAAGAHGMSDADLAATQAGRQSAEAAGVPTTLGEGAVQATGRGQGLLQAQRAVETNTSGAPVFQPYMAARPGQMQAATNNVLDQVAPGTQSPSTIGPQVQSAAQGSLSAERAAINARAAPLYTASQGDLIDPAAYAVLDQHPAYQAALQTVRSDPERAHLITGLSDNSVGVVDATAKRLATLSTQAAGTPLAPGDLHLAAVRRDASNLAHSVADASSPTYAAARQMVAQGHTATLDPMTAGPLGQIAGAPTVQRQTAALYPANPLEGQSAETAAAVQSMNGQDPSAAAALTRQHLSRAYAEAAQDTSKGANLYGGAGFAANVAGNASQHANFQAGLQAAAPQAAGPYDDLVQALMATGKRLPPANATLAELGAALRAQKTDANERVVTGGVAMEGMGPAGLAMIPVSHIASKALNAVNSWRVGRNASALADALTAPAEQTSVVIQDARAAGDRQRQALGQALLESTTQGAAPQR